MTKSLYWAMVLALSLGLVVAPSTAAIPEGSRSEAEAHVATGRTEVRKLEKLSGRVYRGYVTSKIHNTPREDEFDRNHIHERQLVAYIGVSKTKRGKYHIDSRTLVAERWNRNYFSGPLRPRITCRPGTWIRAVGVHRVRAVDVIEIFGDVHLQMGDLEQHEFIKMGKATPCK